MSPDPVSPDPKSPDPKSPDPKNPTSDDGSPEDVSPSDVSPEDSSAGERTSTDAEAEYAEQAGEPVAPRRPDASMTLLTSMLERPLDPGYQAAADQRTSRGESPSTGWRSPLLLVWLLIIGLVVGISANTLRAGESERSRTTSALIERIEDRQDLVDERSARARELQQQIDEETTIDGEEPSATQQLRIVNGLVAVEGPGLRVSLDDASGSRADDSGDPRSGVSDDGRVLSRDLQLVVNGLWEAGAEAIAINGQRLTSRSAIRFAGQAILVNFRPLNRPYVIEAIGDPGAMQTSFAQSSAGSYLTGLSQNYGVRTSLTVQDDLVLPSQVISSSQYARVPAASSGPTRTTPDPTEEES